VPDVLDGAPGSPGLSSDPDGDGVPATTDLDDDNDGVPDSVEAPGGIDVDSDGDGLVDRLDADSDNDGIPDTIDGSGDAALDGDGDGVLDDLTDSNGDGLADIIAVSMLPVDTDADGIPDYLDLDSDQDGISDLSESADDPASLDADDDGRLDTSVDADRDGLMDVTDPQVSDGGAGSAYVLADKDGDGRANYRDLDSDGDNMDDALENGDFDNNGVPDYRQNDDGLETAVTGSGAGSLGVFGLLGLALLLIFRQLRPGGVAMLLCLPTVAALLSQPAEAAQRCEWQAVRLTNADCWYLQGGLGYTRVDPEGRSNGWHTSDDSSDGYKLSLGRYFKPKWFAELSYSDLGKAKLDNLNPLITGTPTISYRVAALFAGYQLRELESRWNLYGKLGVSAIRNEADDDRVDYDKQTSVQLALGVGLQWRINRRWFARLEYDGYDRDARFGGISIGAFLGDPPERD
jgi:opacity protein-like surface antigen